MALQRCLAVGIQAHGGSLASWCEATVPIVIAEVSQTVLGS